MKNQKGFSVIEALLMLIIVGIIGGVIYYVYNANKQEIKISDSSVQHQKAITKEEFIDEVESEVKSLELDNLAETKIVTPTPESGYASIQIFDKDGYSTGMETPLLEIVLNAELNCPIADYGEEECPADLDLTKEVNNAEKVYGAISSVASKNSLAGDSINSHEILKANQADIEVPFGQYADIYAGYENDSFKCIVKLPNMPSVFVDAEPNIAVTKKISIALGCVNVDEYEEQHELQNLLLDAFLKKQNVKREPFSGEGAGVEKKDGDFVYGGTTGAYAVWKKIDGSWKYLFGGHESPSCNDADGYGIPEDLMGSNPSECYDGEKLRPIR